MLDHPLQLPCGIHLKNRLAKASMSENMAIKGGLPGENFVKLYEQWSRGGAGLLITGNVMFDPENLGEIHNVVLDKKYSRLDLLMAWAAAGKKQDCKVFMQINHPGKQSPSFLTKTPKAPSAIGYTSHLAKAFNPPRALSETEIQETIDGYVHAANLAQQGGFDGVQIHGAHGYLISQFLSPLHNHRTDQWGGSLENRMRFLLQIYQRMREKLGTSFGIGVKLNSADFQRGGFSEEESIYVVEKLSALGIDLIEISGGTYESTVMMGHKSSKTSTANREAYFIEFATKARQVCSCPLMLTGGFRSKASMEHALENVGIDLVGIARPLCVNPALPKQILSQDHYSFPLPPRTTGFPALDRFIPLEILWYTNQIHRMGKGKAPVQNRGNLPSIFEMMKDTGLAGLRRVRT